MNRTLIFTLVITIGVFSIACASRTTNRVESAVTSPSEDIPENLPKELIYPGARSNGFFGGEIDGKFSGLGTLEIKTSVRKVTEYYKNLEAEGWKIEDYGSGRSNEGKFSYIDITKETWRVAITTGKVRRKSQIVILYSEK